MARMLERSALPPIVGFNTNATTIAAGMIIASLLLLFLYLGKHVFEPLALAILLSFILAPLVRKQRKWGLNRPTSVISTVVVAIGLLGTLGYVMATQISDLAETLPRYEGNLREKVKSLRGTTVTSGALDKAAQTLEELQKEITRPDPAKPAVAAPEAAPGAPGSVLGRRGDEPVVVELKDASPTSLQSLTNIISPLLTPLATTGLVILFLVFILFQREDLRDRFLRLAGTRDLQRSTEAMNDAASRLSKFFLIQTALNAGVGVTIGVGLWIIGVPSPILWGILAGLMRFVPFIGSYIAGVFPLALAAAVDPGWTMVIATLILFIIVEASAGQIVEPMLYGHNTGLSPVAIVIATLFWTLLWGPLGLLLATPLTVCLVVLGRHVESLAFLDIMLGDKPALEPEERFYQRLLAGDATEAAEQAEVQLKAQSLSSYYDDVPMKALALAQADASLGKLTDNRQVAICDTVEEIVEDLADYTDEVPQRAAIADGSSDAEKPDIAEMSVPPVLTDDELAPAWRVPNPVLAIASRSSLDEAAATLLGHLLTAHGVRALVQPYSDVAKSKRFAVDAPEAQLVCLSYFGATSNPVHVRYLIRRLKRAMPHAKFLAGFWLLAGNKLRAEEWRTLVGADFVATSLTEATAIVVQQATIVTTADPVAPAQPLPASDAASAHHTEEQPAPIALPA